VTAAMVEMVKMPSVGISSIERDWYGCYGNSWHGAIVDAAFAHPAKFSRSLIRCIYDHAVEQGWMGAGDVVLDPFGGVATGALDAMRLGMHWLGIEIEPRFVEIGNANIEFWEGSLAEHFSGFGTARLMRGDSRDLAQIVTAIGACVSSPPYANGCAHTGGDDPHPEYVTGGEYRGVGITGAISSPPYASSLDRGVVDADRRREFARSRGISNVEHVTPIDMEKVGQRNQTDYGASPGQMGMMRVGEFFADEPPGQSRGSGDTFWNASRAIVEQVHQVLTPGAIAMWVVKAFVRDGKRVDFPVQWFRLCQMCGFEMMEWIRAWLIEGDDVEQIGLLGERVPLRRDHKSFFRRLAESKGSPRVDYEVVLVTRKR
jgi:tRNA G10  N-methylase Trm11